MLAELGADVNLSLDDMSPPIFYAAKRGQVEAVRALAELGADINARGGSGTTPVFTATAHSHTEVIQVLAELGADLELECSSELFPRPHAPLIMALQRDRREAASLLVSMGVAVRESMVRLLLKSIPIRERIRDEMTALQERIMAHRAGGGESTSEAAVCSAYSLAKLLSSVSHNRGEEGDSGDEAEEARRDSLAELETNLVMSMGPLLRCGAVGRMQDTPYPVRRRLARLAHRVLVWSLQQDGERVTAETAACRYVELACFLLDREMLSDVLSLRLTCRSNFERRRFPVCCESTGYVELEANLVEEWLGCGSGCSSRFVSTGVISTALTIHET